MISEIFYSEKVFDVEIFIALFVYCEMFMKNGFGYR